MGKDIKKLGLIIAVLVLVACGTVQDMSQAVKDAGVDPNLRTGKMADQIVAKGSCPVIEIVQDLGSVHEHTNEASPSPQNLISTAEIKEIQSTCSYGLKSVTVDLKLGIESTIGPQGKLYSSDKPFFSYPFFVAVTSSAGTILAKEIFAASMTYEPDEASHTYREELRQIIPTEGRYEGSRYKILVGFQTSKAQLEYNRELARRKAANERAMAEKARLDAEKALNALKKESDMKIEQRKKASP